MLIRLAGNWCCVFRSSNPFTFLFWLYSSLSFTSYRLQLVFTTFLYSCRPTGLAADIHSFSRTIRNPRIFRRPRSVNLVNTLVCSTSPASSIRNKPSRSSSTTLATAFWLYESTRRTILHLLTDTVQLGLVASDTRFTTARKVTTALYTPTLYSSRLKTGCRLICLNTQCLGPRLFQPMLLKYTIMPTGTKRPLLPEEGGHGERTRQVAVN